MGTFLFLNRVVAAMFIYITLQTQPLFLIMFVPQYYLLHDHITSLTNENINNGFLLASKIIKQQHMKSFTIVFNVKHPLRMSTICIYIRS